MERRLAAILTALCLLLVSPVARAAGPQPQQWIAISDIHFSPYVDAHLTERLAETPPERWRAVFASAGPMKYSNFGTDTNYALLESSLDAMKSQVPQPQVVVFTGDFLAHDFRAPFDAAAKNHGDDAYHEFVDKTVAFLALELRTAFPKSQIVPVIGNNDGYCGDYASTPRSFFLLHMAQAFAPSIGTRDPAAFVSKFTTGGYYTIALPAGNAQAVVVNDVFWSSHYANTCGERNADPGTDELNWLRTTLATPPGPTWVLAHEPPGIDVYSTLRAAVRLDAPVVPMLSPKYNDAYVSMLAAPASHVAIALAGHIHMNAMHVVGGPGPGAAAMLLIPSISPVYLNNPTFSVLDVDAASAGVLDDHVFVLDDLPALAKDAHHAVHWRREYDFNGTYGAHGIDAASLQRLQEGMFADDKLRRKYSRYFDGESGRTPITDATWRAYWCGNVAMTPTAYRACATPQVQASLPPHPPAPSPPPPTPSPAASATP